MLSGLLLTGPRTLLYSEKGQSRFIPTQACFHQQALAKGRRRVCVCPSPHPQISKLSLTQGEMVIQTSGGLAPPTTTIGKRSELRAMQDVFGVLFL